MRGFVAISATFLVTLVLLQDTASAASLRGANAMNFRCPTPRQIHQGSVTYTGLTPGSKATYSCQSGCIMTGQAQLQCTTFGTWSPSEPECRVQYLTKNDNSYKNRDKGYKLYSG